MNTVLRHTGIRTVTLRMEEHANTLPTLLYLNWLNAILALGVFPSLFFEKQKTLLRYRNSAVFSSDILIPGYCLIVLSTYWH